MKPEKKEENLEESRTHKIYIDAHNIYCRTVFHPFCAVSFHFVHI